MKVLTNNLIGRYYPFFLNNKRLGSSYYLYQIYSPGISSDNFPQVSLVKISERTLQEYNEPEGKGIDLLAMASGITKPNKNIPKILEWLQKGYQFPDNIEFVGNDFPRLEMEPTNQNTQRNLIILLRDAIRWNKQRFFDGRLVDILWDKDHFMVCLVKNKEGMVSLEPKAMYHVLDPNLSKPLPIPNIKNLPDSLRGKEFKEIGGGKCPGLCQALKRIEWDSFDRGYRKINTEEEARKE